jgi:hypothetical protein
MRWLKIGSRVLQIPGGAHELFSGAIAGVQASHARGVKNLEIYTSRRSLARSREC